MVFQKEHQVSEEVRKKISIGNKGKTSWIKGKKGLYKQSEETKKKNSISHLGKKLSEEHRKKISVGNKGKIRTDETRKKISLSNTGKHLSEESKLKIGLASKGRKMTQENIEKQRLRMVGNTHGFKKGQVSSNKGKKASKELIKKLSESHIGQKAWNKGKKGLFKHTEEWKIENSKRMKGKKMSLDSRRKLRISTISYIENNCKGISPRQGKNEKQILDELENLYNHKIKRQYHIKSLGYFLDGYIPELNLAIEVDERPKNKERDIERQKEIEEKLGCKFLRIKDYD